MQDRGANRVDGADDRARIGVEECQVFRRAEVRRRRGARLDVAADGIVGGIVDGGKIGDIGSVHGKNEVGTPGRFYKMSVLDESDRAGMRWVVEATR